MSGVYLLNPTWLTKSRRISYGFLNQFRPPPALPNQVYRFDPDTGEVRVVADGFVQPNGIAFTADGETAYMQVVSFSNTPESSLPRFRADTGEAGGVLEGNDPTKPATMCVPSPRGYRVT